MEELIILIGYIMTIVVIVLLIAIGFSTYNIEPVEGLACFDSELDYNRFMQTNHTEFIVIFPCGGLSK